ncbi:MAG TPA: hypothetical protein VKL22_00880 [Actinomycetota bacterium]|nr:hypothetical protein [Actinomycetota bacterium]
MAVPNSGNMVGMRSTCRRAVSCQVSLVAALVVLLPAGGRAQAPPLLRFTSRPPAAPAGAIVAVTGVDPCPPPAGASSATATVVQTFRDAGGDGARTTIPVRLDGTWSGGIRIGGRPGGVSLSASCSTGTGAPYASYASIPFTVRTVGDGYWIPRSNGYLHAFGDANVFGSLAGSGSTKATSINGSLVGIAALPTTGTGYWEAASDGGVFAFGDAAFFGSAAPLPLKEPVVGIAAAPDGQGYWLAGADGGVFPFGSARFYGSAASLRLNRPVVGIAATSTGGGYWLASSDGGILSFGDAPFIGSAAPMQLNKPVVGIAPAGDDRGYWLAGRDGGVFTFGSARFYGSGVPDGGIPTGTAIGIAATPGLGPGSG